MRGLGVALVVLVAAGVAAWLLTSGGTEGTAGRSGGGEERGAGPVAEAPTLRGAGPEAGGEGDAAAAPREGAAAPADDGLRVFGRVVDETRRPVRGASVDVRLTEGGTAEGRTDDGGAFSLRVALPRSGVSWSGVRIRALDAEGRSDVAQAWWRAEASGEVDAGVLVLGPSFPLDVRVVHRGSPVAGARVEAGAQGGYPGLAAAEAVSGPDGIASLRHLREGAYGIVAVASGHGRGRGAAVLPRAEPGPLELELPEERILDVLVVEAGSGTPIPGAKVEVWETVRGPDSLSSGPYQPPPEVAPTDAEGKTRIRGLAPGTTLALAAKVEGRPPVQAHGPGRRENLAPDATEARIELPALRTVRWPLVAGDVPVPESGATVRLRQEAGTATSWVPAEGRIEKGELVVDWVPPGFFHGMAVAPDGALARLFVKGDTDLGNETSFRRARRIDVWVKSEAGAPIAGMFASARNQGNNPLSPSVATDAEGHAVIGELHGGLADVYLSDTPQPWAGARIGSADLEKGDGKVEVSLPDEEEYVVRLTVEGRPGLPARMAVQPGRVVAEDPERGEVRLRARPGLPEREHAVQVTAVGYLPANGKARPGVPLDLALERGGLIAVTVKAPADGRYSLMVESWSEVDGKWTMAISQFGPMARGTTASGGAPTYGPLKPGRYRVTDRRSGVASEPVDVRAGPEPVRVSLDLSAAGFVKGRIEGPAGTSIAGAMVVVEGLAEDPFRAGGVPGGQPVGPNGEFRVKVPGDRDVTLRAWHPLLAPAPKGGSVVVREPREGVVLRLVAGPTARFVLPGAREAAKLAVEPMRILLFRGDPDAGPPVSEHRVESDGEGLRFGGFAAGTYTVWIDVQGHAPVVIRDAKLAEGETELGELTPSRGSSLRVKLLLKEGEAAPRIYASASRTGAGPTYARYVNSNGETEVVLPGLGPGTFQVHAGLVMGMGSGRSQATIRETIEVDGTTDVERTLDLR